MQFVIKRSREIQKLCIRVFHRRVIRQLPAAHRLGVGYRLPRYPHLSVHDNRPLKKGISVQTTFSRLKSTSGRKITIFDYFLRIRIVCLLGPCFYCFQISIWKSDFTCHQRQCSCVLWITTRKSFHRKNIRSCFYIITIHIDDC